MFSEVMVDKTTAQDCKQVLNMTTHTVAGYSTMGSSDVIFRKDGIEMLASEQDKLGSEQLLKNMAEVKTSVEQAVEALGLDTANAASLRAAIREATSLFRFKASLFDFATKDRKRKRSTQSEDSDGSLCTFWAWNYWRRASGSFTCTTCTSCATSWTTSTT